MRARHILAADSERNMRSALFTALTRLGHAVELAEDCSQALEKIREEKFSLILCDLKLAGGGGLMLLKESKKLCPDTDVIVMSQGGGVEDAVSAMREGAQDFLMKPFPAGVVEHAIAKIFSRDEEESKDTIDTLKKDPEGGHKPIIFKSEIMGRLLSLAKNMASSEATVLLQGESGTGKELFARFIHNYSSKKGGPFVAVNCAGLPESLLESELFGHEKGAFTGALNRKLGKFDLADGGTLLLDEISEMDISLQAKLLRALQEGEIDPVGGKGPHKIDVRVIATTNRKLKAWVDEGKFRADLYYRLNVMPFFIPPLKDRTEDIEPLALYFIEKFARQNGKATAFLEPDALEVLLAHDWPGNIRELENTIARAVLMSGGQQIGAQDIFMDESGFLVALERNCLAREKEAKGQDLIVEDTYNTEDMQKGEDFPKGLKDSYPSQVAFPTLRDNVLSVQEDLRALDIKATSKAMPMMTIEEMERRLIGRALDETSGNRTHAAKLLGISVRTLRNKLNEYRAERLDVGSAATG
jgi:two-component system response regulator FlrC